MLEQLGIGDWIWIFYVIAFLAVWELIWKTIALWKAARNKQLGWFICIAVFNTVGFLPILYLLTYKKKRNSIE